MSKFKELIKDYAKITQMTYHFLRDSEVCIW